MQDLKIEYVDISSIKPYTNNAKKHPVEQIEQIKNSIQQFGMDDPIGIWGEEIVEGHGRLEACKQLGYKKVPIIRLDHLTDEERKAYTLVHNKLTMNSDFDYNILDEELAGVMDIDMGDFGFNTNDISAEDFGEEFSLAEGDKGNIEQITFTLASEQAEVIRGAVDFIKDNELYTDTWGNENKNGNAIYEVVRQWAEQKKL